MPQSLRNKTQDVNVVEFIPLITPRALKAELPTRKVHSDTVVRGRDAVKRVLAGEDPRFLVIVGPCSIHDEAAALDYAKRLAALAAEVKDRMLVLMRVYFEKPRTTIGWKGLISDPRLDGTNDMSAGLAVARKLLLEVNALGLPAATELLDPIVPQYIADLVSWTAVGARTTESQTHREMASGLSMPVGFKNSTEGNLQIAVDAMQSARNSHSFLGIDQEGRTCVVSTSGNIWGHIILRGGPNNKPNYDAASVASAVEKLEKAKLPPLVMVDCSHANSAKKPERQGEVLRSCIGQRVAGNRALIGAMLESNLFGGSQPLPPDGKPTQYGVSITDPCLDWDNTAALLREAYTLLGK